MWFLTFVPTLMFVANVVLVDQLLDRALADLLMLETLRHKTGLWRYLSINLCGGLVATGGAKGGSTASGGVSDDTNKKFYLFKDSFWGDTTSPDENFLDGDAKHWSALQNTVAAPERYIMPNIHAWLTARSEFTNLLCCTYFHDLEQRRCCTQMFAKLFSNAWGVIVIGVPSIKFHCSLEDLVTQPFVNDPMYHGCAWFTSNNVPAWWI